MKSIEEYNAEIAEIEAQILKPMSPARRLDMVIRLFRLKEEVGEYMKGIRTASK